MEAEAAWMEAEEESEARLAAVPVGMKEVAAMAAEASVEVMALVMAATMVVARTEAAVVAALVRVATVAAAAAVIQTRHTASHNRRSRCQARTCLPLNQAHHPHKHHSTPDVAQAHHSCMATPWHIRLCTCLGMAVHLAVQAEAATAAGQVAEARALVARVAAAVPTAVGEDTAVHRPAAWVERMAAAVMAAVAMAAAVHLVMAVAAAMVAMAAVVAVGQRLRRIECHSQCSRCQGRKCSRQTRDRHPHRHYSIRGVGHPGRSCTATK